MTLTLLFWILMLLWLVAYGWGWSSNPAPWPARFPNLLLFIIILTLGWQVFGAPIK